mmetsp:Transcript_81085/g.241603  ORF Transcript_81085/g.241603 Transcript_81085/m.241603 type:complete len:239 (+) Transcript_81085:389-1105(+)
MAANWGASSSSLGGAAAGTLPPWVPARRPPSSSRARRVADTWASASRPDCPRPPAGAGAAAAPAAAGLLPRLAKGGGLYCDRQAPPPPPPPLECPNCARTGHGGCGKTWWVAQRARWLGLPQEVVAWEPATFEEEGTLAVSGRRAAGPGAGAPGEGRCGGGGSVSDGGAGAAAAASAATVPSTRAAPVLADLSELSDEEIEALRACIDATERPFPQLKRQLPLAHAVQCAEELWEECG